MSHFWSCLSSCVRCYAMIITHTSYMSGNNYFDFLGEKKHYLRLPLQISTSLQNCCCCLLPFVYCLPHFASAKIWKWWRQTLFNPFPLRQPKTALFVILLCLMPCQGRASMWERVKCTNLQSWLIGQFKIIGNRPI